MSGDPDLDSWCAICSTAIALAFIDNKFDARIRIGDFRGTDSHCWVWSDDLNHYDITATQFSAYDEILIVPEDDAVMFPQPWEEVDPHFEEEIEESFRKWPEEQRPNRRKMRELLRAI